MPRADFAPFVNKCKYQFFLIAVEFQRFKEKNMGFAWQKKIPAFVIICKKVFHLGKF